jgi:hypothetical protein
MRPSVTFSLVDTSVGIGSAGGALPGLYVTRPKAAIV